MGRKWGIYQLLILSVALSFGCNDGDTVAAGGSTGVVNPPTNSLNVVCDPFNSSNPAQVGHGIAANLYYLSDDQPRYTDVMSYMNYGHAVNATIFLNDINVPTRYFSDGFFTQSGDAILNQDGNLLYEYFGLHMEGAFTLGPNDTAGDYQIAVLSDDGSILTVNDTGNGYTTLVNNDGTHPTKMGCTTSSLHFNSNTAIPFKYDYYQGPRYHIASVMMWRPMPTDPSLINDPLCNQEGNSLFYDWTQMPSTPQQAYLDLQSRGWKPLAQENFLLPYTVGNVNPCAPNVTIHITNFQISGLSQTSVTFTWNTDVMSDSETSLALYPSTSYSTTIDSTQTLNHTMTITGLTAATVYSVYVTSADGLGDSSAITPTTFRTLR